MNTRIEKDFTFLASIYFEDNFYVNAYDMTISMLVETESVREQNIAMDRAIHFIENVLQHSMLISSEHEEKIQQYKDVGLRTCEIPGEPYDQIIAMLVILKLNAIMEGRLKITDMSFGSALSDGVRYSIVSEVAENILSGQHWWNSSSLSMSHDSDIDFDKVIPLFDNADWVDLGLTWKELAKK